MMEREGKGWEEEKSNIYCTINKDTIKLKWRESQLGIRRAHEACDRHRKGSDNGHAESSIERKREEIYTVTLLFCHI